MASVLGPDGPSYGRAGPPALALGTGAVVSLLVLMLVPSPRSMSRSIRYTKEFMIAALPIMVASIKHDAIPIQSSRQPYKTPQIYENTKNAENSTPRKTALRRNRLDIMQNLMYDWGKCTYSHFWPRPLRSDIALFMCKGHFKSSDIAQAYLPSIHGRNSQLLQTVQTELGGFHVFSCNVSSRSPGCSKIYTFRTVEDNANIGAKLGHSDWRCYGVGRRALI